MLVYDIEIIKAIPDRKSERIEGVEYCKGWHDHANMGISVIVAYDYAEDRYRVFCKDNFKEFESLCQKRDILVSFNGIGFDNKVIRANDINISDDDSYDLLVKVWEGNGLGPNFQYPSHEGYGLDAICAVNFGITKTGHGALAPVDWQQGKIGSVIDYCINDVKLTKRLLDHVIKNGYVISPKENKALIKVKRPC